MFSSLSNNERAKVFASSVLPTPVGPRNINEPIGLFSSLSPALARITAFATAVTASFWPITLSWSSSSSLSSFSLSPSTSLVTGIPVHLDTISEISFSVTSSLSSAVSYPLLIFSSYSLIWLSSFGISPYCISATLLKSYSLSYFSTCPFNSSSFAFKFLTCSIWFFSFSYLAVISSSLDFNSANSFSSTSRRFLLFSSSSASKASFSVSKVNNFLLTISSSVGRESISLRIIAPASSIKSIALSGRNLSVIYLSDNLAAATIALSCILIPWCISKRSFKPLSIDIVSSTVGSEAITGWKRLSKALSFSIYFLYSSNVVAPIQFNSPRASIGLIKLPASIEPSVLPAPTIVWISSINKIILPSAFWTSFNTAFRRSSNSPLYFAPAINAPISSEKIILSFNPSGTSPLTILSANPSTIAVLPTPGSPIKTGLFLVLLDKILIILLISSSLPITGSNLCFLAKSTKLVPNLASAS